MKRTRSTVLAAASASALALTLAACGGDAGGGSGSGDGGFEPRGDVTMLVGNGYVPGHADYALELLRGHDGVRKLFERRL